MLKAIWPFSSIPRLDLYNIGQDCDYVRFLTRVGELQFVIPDMWRSDSNQFAGIETRRLGTLVGHTMLWLIGVRDIWKSMKE